MNQAFSKLPDGVTPGSAFEKWAYNAISSMGRASAVTGVKMGNTTRGLYVVPERARGGGSSDQIIGQIDQAIFVKRPIPEDAPPGTTPKYQIFATRGGYVFKLGSDASVLKSNRFTVPSFGESYLCYDDVNDKIICSFWNEIRADDQFIIETYNARKLYRVNPDTLEVEASASVDFGLLTKVYSGSHKLLFRAGKILCVLYGRTPTAPLFLNYLIRVDPTTFSTEATKILNLNAFWADISLDDGNSYFWVSDADDQCVKRVNLADFTTRDDFFTNDIATSPGAGVVGTITCDLVSLNDDSSTKVTNFGSFGAGYYLFQWVSGVCQLKDPDDPDKDKFFVGFFGTQGGVEVIHDFRTVFNGFLQTTSVGVSVQAYDTADEARSHNGGLVGPSIDVTSGSFTEGIHPNGFCQFLWNISDTYPVNTRVRHGASIWTTKTGPSTGVTPTDSQWDGVTNYSIGDFVIYATHEYRALTNNINKQPNSNPGDWTDLGTAIWTKWADIIDEYSFNLVQQFVYGGTPIPYSPYGVAWSSVASRLYSTTRTEILLRLNPDTSTWETVVLGDTDALPYICRENPKDGLIYVVGYLSNKIYVVDPSTNQLIKIIGSFTQEELDGDSRRQNTTFDSPFDIIFPNTEADLEDAPTTATDSKAIAVQHGLNGLKPFTVSLT